MATQNTITPADYLTMLESHNWNWPQLSMGSSRRGYRNPHKDACRAMASKLNLLAQQNETLRALYEAYIAYIDGTGEKPTLDQGEDKQADLMSAYAEYVEAGAAQPRTTNVAEIAAQDATQPAKTFTHANLAKLMADGKVARIEFVKRTTGELRIMRARLGVTKHLTGAGSKYSAKAKNLLTVFDMDKGGYRSIPVDGVRSVQTCGQLIAA